MSIRTKMIGTCALLLAFGFAMGVLAVGRQYELAWSMKRLRNVTAVCVDAASLVHEVQRERGMTAGYLGSGGQEFANEIVEQRARVDERVAAVTDSLPQLAAVGVVDTKFTRKIRMALDQLSDRDEMRASVSSRTAKLKNALAFYTSVNSSILDAISCASEESLDRGVTASLHAYAYLLKAKERSGIERAVLTNTFARDAFGEGMLEKFIGLLSTQDTYLHEFTVYANDEEAARYADAEAHPSFERVQEFRARALERAATGGFERDPKEWFDTISQKIDTLYAAEIDIAQSLRATAVAVGNEARTATWVIVGITFGAGALAVCAVLFLLRNSIKPLGRIAEAIREIAEGDDLTARIEVDRNDELGHLAESFNRFVAIRVQSMTKHLDDSAVGMASSSEQLAATANQLAEGAGVMNRDTASVAEAAQGLDASVREMVGETTRISSTVDRVSTSLTQLSASVNEIASNTAEASQTAGDAAAEAKAADGNVADLAQAASEIGTVIEVIESIAEQVDLLALNATIEAARAGDAGRGFAVVAGEVKKLARQTAEAIEDIRNRIFAIQNTTDTSIHAIKSIVSSIDRVHEISASIATAVEQQSLCANEVESALKETSSATSTVAHTVQNVSVVSESIAQQIHRVAESVEDASRAAMETSKAGQNLSVDVCQLRTLIGSYVVESSEAG